MYIRAIPETPVFRFFSPAPVCTPGNRALRSKCSRRYATADRRRTPLAVFVRCGTYVGLDPFRGGNGLGCQATEGMDGTRKYAWYTGRGQTRPVFFCAPACLTGVGRTASGTPRHLSHRPVCFRLVPARPSGSHQIPEFEAWR